MFSTLALKSTLQLGLKVSVFPWLTFRTDKKKDIKQKFKFKCSNHENNKRKAAKSYKFNSKYEKIQMQNLKLEQSQDEKTKNQREKF